MNGGTNDYFYKYFRANSVFDPNPAVGGLAATGFNQWAGLYQQYLVYGSKINVQIIPRRSTDTNLFYIVPTLDTAPLWVNATSYRVEDQPYAKRQLIEGYQMVTNNHRMKHYMTTKKIFGHKDSLEILEYGALTTTNPTAQWYWGLYSTTFGFNELLTGTQQDVDASIIITYYVKFCNRIMVAG